jgi:shikimate kinase
METMNKAGITVFLDVPAKEITARILKTDLSARPLFAGVHPENLKDNIEFMRSQRLPFYRRSTLAIKPELTVTQLAKMIQEATGH